MILLTALNLGLVNLTEKVSASTLVFIYLLSIQVCDQHKPFSFTFRASKCVEVYKKKLIKKIIIPVFIFNYYISPFLVSSGSLRLGIQEQRKSVTIDDNLL